MSMLFQRGEGGCHEENDSKLGERMTNFRDEGEMEHTTKQDPTKSIIKDKISNYRR